MGLLSFSFAMRLLLAAFLAPLALAAQTPSVARINVTPAAPSVIAGETLQLKAEPVDSAGRPVTGATIRFQGGVPFEGTVDQNGLVSAGAPGALDITVSAIVPGQRPIVRRLTIEVKPGPAATIVLDPRPKKLLVGQEIRVGASTYSKSLEPRLDQVTWSSSAPRIARAGTDGMLTALSPGRAVITAAAGNAKETLEVEVVAADIASIAVTPARPRARTGDVIRFELSAKDAAGREITGLTPTWLMAGGDGLIGSDGGFVGYKPQTYTITASLGRRSATTSATLAARDVRRAATVVGGLPSARTPPPSCGFIRNRRSPTCRRSSASSTRSTSAIPRSR